MTKLSDAAIVASTALLALYAGVQAGFDQGEAESVATRTTPSDGLSASLPVFQGVDNGDTRPILLPVVNWMADNDVCRTWITATNVGGEDGVPILAFFTEGSPVYCAGPLKMECGGLLKPGASWDFLGAQVSSGSASGILYSFSNRQLDEIDGSNVAGLTAAQYVCDRTFYGIVGDCVDYVEFATAYVQRSMWAGIPMSEAVGPPMVVTLQRHCPADVTPGAEATSMYTGVPLGASTTTDGEAPHRVDLVASDLDVAYIQNGGVVTGTVAISFDAEGDLDGADCGTVTVQPGDMVPFAIDACGETQTGALLRFDSNVPIAIVGESIAANSMSTEAGQYPAWAPGVLTPQVDGPAWMAARAPIFGGGEDTATRVNVWVRNLGDTDVPVQARLRGSDGTELDAATDLACAGCNVPLSLVAPSFEPDGMSLEVTGQGLTQVPLRAHAWVATSNGGGSVLSAYEIALPPAFEQLDDEGSWVVPLMANDVQGTGVIGALAVSNFSSSATAEINIRLSDANDAVAGECRSIPPHSTIVVDPPRMLPAGGATAAVITLRHWSPAAPSSDLVPGIAVASMLVTGRELEGDIPADEVSVTAGTYVPGPIQMPGPSFDACDFEVQPRPDPEAHPDRLAMVAGRGYLPVIHYQGQDSVCAPTISVTNDGDAPARYALVAWSEPGFCPPQCAGPIRVVCSPEVAAGGSWTPMLGDSMSAVVYSFTAQTLGDLGIEPGSDQPAAEHLCELLSSTIVGNCNEYHRFDLAYGRGSSFGDLPLGLTYGGPISVTVERECLHRDTPGTTVTSTYEGVQGPRFDPRLNTGGAWVQSVVPIYADFQDQATVTYLQNGGQLCTTATIAFVEHGSDDPVLCRVFTLSPGESYPFAATDCVGPNFSGFAVIRSEEPLAIVSDVISAQGMRTFPAFPTANPFDLDGDGDVDQDDVAILEAALGRATGEHDWDARLDYDANGRIDEHDLAVLWLNLDAGAVTATPSATATHEGGDGTPTPQNPTPERRFEIFLPFGETPSSA